MLVETRLGRLFVEDAGEGDPVVLWHSFLCDGGMWRHQVPALAAKYRVLNVDGPGHGRSAAIRRPFTLEECAEAAIEVLESLEIDRAHWIGLSWGGMTGMRVALHEPHRLRSLVVLDSSAHRESRRKLPKYYAMRLAVRAFGPGLPILLDRLPPIFFSRQTLASRPELARELCARVARMDEESLQRCVDAIIFERRDITNELCRIRVPTLVLCGSDDAATPFARSEAIADAIAGARLEEIRGAGHLSALEAPDAVNEALLSFLDGVA